MYGTQVVNRVRPSLSNYTSLSVELYDKKFDIEYGKQRMHLCTIESNNDDIQPSTIPFRNVTCA